MQEEATVGQAKEEELQELHFTRSISPSPLPPARLSSNLNLFSCPSLRFIRMAGKELILGPPWEEANLDREWISVPEGTNVWGKKEIEIIHLPVLIFYLFSIYSIYNHIYLKQ